jgi:hypothetical protein
MATIDDELLLDEQENQREIAFIRRQLPADLKERFTDDQLLWMLDTLVDYYVESGVLDTDADEVDIDLEEVADHVCRQAIAEGKPHLDAQDVFFVVEADLDFQEQNL